MKRAISSILSLLIVTLISLSSCASSPAIAREISDDCLVLIPSTLANKDNASTARDYYLVISNGLKTIKIGKDRSGFVAVRLRAPGAKIIGLTSSVNGSDATGESVSYDLNIPLPYRRGEVVVADYTFQQYLEKLSSTSFQSSWNFVETQDADYQQILAMFMKTDSAKTWKK